MQQRRAVTCYSRLDVDARYCVRDPAVFLSDSIELPCAVRPRLRLFNDDDDDEFDIPAREEH